jgi:hypothetical protein
MQYVLVIAHAQTWNWDGGGGGGGEMFCAGNLANKPRR